MDHCELPVKESVFKSMLIEWSFTGICVRRALLEYFLGRPVLQSIFVDSDHTSNFVTRRLHSGIMILINNALIRTFRKKQNTGESITFGSKLVLLRIARGMTVKQCLKLKSISMGRFHS